MVHSVLNVFLFVLLFFSSSSKDRDTIFCLRGPWANRVTSKAIQNLEGSLGVLPWKKFETTLFKLA